jgi:hypothetical protein
MNEKEYENEFLTKPKKPPKHNQRHGAGQITYDQNGLYIATNKLILDNFSVDEYVHVLSKGSIEHLYNQIMYYMKLDFYHCNKYIKIIKALVKMNEQLKEENERMKKELKTQKTLFNFNKEEKE